MSIRNSDTRLIFMAMLVTLLLTGCDSDMEGLNRYIAEVKQRPADPIEPIPPVATYTPHLYTASALRNPFLPETADEMAEADDDSDQGNGIRPDPNRPREYLEGFSLDTLSMVGTFEREESKWSLIRDPDGVIHRVAINNYIGQNHGRVVSVSPDHVEITELISNGAGGWLERNTSVAMDDS